MRVVVSYLTDSSFLWLAAGWLEAFALSVLCIGLLCATSAVSPLVAVRVCAMILAFDVIALPRSLERGPDFPKETVLFTAGTGIGLVFLRKSMPTMSRRCRAPFG